MNDKGEPCARRVTRTRAESIITPPCQLAALLLRSITQFKLRATYRSLYDRCDNYPKVQQEIVYAIFRPPRWEKMEIRVRIRMHAFVPEVKL